MIRRTLVGALLAGTLVVAGSSAGAAPSAPSGPTAGKVSVRVTLASVYVHDDGDNGSAGDFGLDSMFFVSDGPSAPSPHNGTSAWTFKQIDNGVGTWQSPLLRSYSSDTGYTMPTSNGRNAVVTSKAPGTTFKLHTDLHEYDGPNSSTHAGHELSLVVPQAGTSVKKTIEVETETSGSDHFRWTMTYVITAS